MLGQKQNYVESFSTWYSISWNLANKIQSCLLQNVQLKEFRLPRVCAQGLSNCRFLEFGTNCRLGRIVAWDELSLFQNGTNCRLFKMGRIDAWDELSFFGIWDELSLGTNRRLGRIVALRCAHIALIKCSIQ